MLEAPLNTYLRRVLGVNEWTRWLHLVQLLMDVELLVELELFNWKSKSSGVFMVKYMYIDFMNVHS